MGERLVGDDDLDQGDPRVSCYPKKPYFKRKTAERIAARIFHETNKPMVAYGCIHCGMFHVGGRVVGRASG